MKQGELLAIGAAYVDINAPNFPLGAQGLQLESEVVGGEYVVELGGSAVNFARICTSLGVPTGFIGKVGNDDFGAVLSRLLLASGVKPLLIQSDDVSTNVSFNMVNPSGESIMAIAGTANQSLTPDEVYVRASERIAGSAFLYLGGCFKLKKLLPVFTKLAQDARAAGVSVVLDHGRLNHDITDEEKHIVRELVAVSNIYLPSANEFMQLWGVSSIDEGLRLMNERPGVTTVVKHGDKGAITIVDGTITNIPAYTIDPIHTIGAGDSFNAGFIAAQYATNNIVESVRFGCATAALKLSRQQLPTISDVSDLMAETKSIPRM